MRQIAVMITALFLTTTLALYVDAFSVSAKKSDENKIALNWKKLQNTPSFKKLEKTISRFSEKNKL